MTVKLAIRGIGEQMAEKLAKLNIFSIEDLLFHLPIRYQDRTTLSPLRSLVVGQGVLIQGEIKRILQPVRGRTKLLCEISDSTGKLFLRFFHVLPYQLKRLTTGSVIRCFGMVKMGENGLEMIHPDWQILSSDQNNSLSSHLTPIYPTTEGLSQHRLRQFMQQALHYMQRPAVLPEVLPDGLCQQLGYPALKEALWYVHQPPREAWSQLETNETSAQKRLIFEELLAHRLSLLQLKQSLQAQPSISLAQSNHLITNFYHQLPYQLTQAQQRVMAEIEQDLKKPYPMLRLVQGDVGSGKTVIAAAAMLQAVMNGYQAAMMAPTELLAEQHFRVFEKWLVPLGVKVVFIAGRLSAREKGLAHKAIEKGEAQIVLGTHALFQQRIQFARLALVVTDEQHRFGVAQRVLFREKGRQCEGWPHQLMLTATPIPRTLAMSFYADLDVSTIDELPPGRLAITTSVMSNDKRHEVIASIQKACTDGKQVYWVCPLIEESEVINSQAATTTAKQLQTLLPTLKVGLIHGRLSPAEKESTMRAFQQGDIQLLVATTVIEVGVDVPNASVMIIENAERLGLSQLHQLRGRVGRGCISSYCVLLYQQPLSLLAKERLKVMRETTDGLHIAKRDLELRGPGEVLGTRQTGEMLFRIADILRDAQMLSSVQAAADNMQKNFPEMGAVLIQRWLGSKVNYGSA